MSQKNSNLHAAKAAKNDEFYTRLEDIENELKHYKGFFKGKTVYCNCDDPKESNFFKFFSMNFENYGLKKLITTGYNENGHGYLYIYEGDKNGNRMVDNNEIQVVELQGNGDFRSEECIEYLKESDVVVTNEPFSLFREYIKQLMDYGKKFLIIGNMNAITYKEVFPYIKNNQLWTGYKNFSGGMDMIQPKESFDKSKTKSFTIDDKGNIIKNIMGVIWYTNIPHAKRNQPLDLWKKYNPIDNPLYDNYLAFNVNKVAEIPEDEYVDIEIRQNDYNKWKKFYGDDVEIIEQVNSDSTIRIRIHYPVFGVPITYLGSWCPAQFEIVGATESEGTGFSNGLFDTNFLTKQALVNGKRVYKRIFIKKVS